MTKICLVSTVKTSWEELRKFVFYNINIGIDLLILYFDDPGDGNIILIQEFNHVKYFICDEKYWHNTNGSRPKKIQDRQICNVNRAFTYARTQGFDWLIHIDSDELLLSNKKIHDILQAIRNDCLIFSLKEAVPEQIYYESRFDATLFRNAITEANHPNVALALAEGCHAALFEGDFFRGHTASKVAVRLSAQIEWMGIHGVQRPQISTSHSKEIVLLHYDCIGFADWKIKWSNRRDNNWDYSRAKPSRGKAFKLFCQANGSIEKEMEIYKRIHLMPDNEIKILKKYDLLEIVEIDKTFFESLH